MRLILMFISVSVVAQTDLVYPWVTNNSQYRGTIVVVNPNPTSASVTLVARRNNGNVATANRTISAFEQLVEDAGILFPSLGEGPGFAVRLTSSSSDLTGAFVVNGTASPSGNSPAQANVIDPSSASDFVMYSYLPIPTDGGNSAPVVVNLGGSEADVTFHAYQDGDEVGSFAVMVAAGRPYAQVTSAMFPGVSGDLYVVAESDQPVVGMAFIFNSLTEPSMSNATPVSGLPPIPGSLSMETSSCPFLNVLCDWDSTSIPYSRTSTSTVSISGSNTISHGHFRLIAKGQDYVVSDVMAIDENEITTAELSGIQTGQVIKAGQNVTFSAQSGRTGGQQAKLHYVVDVQDVGRVIDYRINLTSNKE